MAEKALILVRLIIFSGERGAPVDGLGWADLSADP